MSSSDNDPKKAEEMSLAELLGNSEAASIPSDAGQDEDDSDEDKSGLINLSQMASLLSQPPAATPPQDTTSYSGNPGVGSPAGGGSGFAANSGFQTTQQPSAGLPSVDPATTSAFADVAAPAKKKPVALIVVAAIALIAGGVGAYFALSEKSDEARDAKLAELEKELAQVESSVSTEASAETGAGNVNNTAAASVPAKNAETASAPSGDAQAVAGDATAEGENTSAIAEADGAGDEEYEETEEVVDDGKGGKHKRKVRRLKKRSTAKTTAAAKTTTVAKKESAPAKANAPAAATKSSGKTSALDSLLAGGGGSSSKDSGGLPQKPSRAQVQSAMAPVVNKARNSCKSSGSGKVSVRIVVGSNGVVRDAIPLGAHSADSLGRCVATFARKTARLPAFKSPTFTFTYPFNI